MRCQVSMKLERFRYDIQGLRALAVILVVLNHSQIIPLSGGYIGVDVFFVISGFIITGALLRELEINSRIDMAGFYARRIKRLLPTALLVTIVIVIGTTMIMTPRGSVSVYDDATWANLFAANFRLVATQADYFAQGSLPSPFQHYWSLSVEEQFYVLWPLLLIGVTLAIKQVTQRKVAILLVAATVILVSFIISVSMTIADPLMAYFSPLSRAWELTTGAAIAVTYARVRISNAKLAFWLRLVGVLLILSAAIFFTAETPFPGSLALLPVIGAAAIIIAGNGDTSDFISKNLLSNRVMVWLGSISYGLYLWHWATLTLWHWTTNLPADPWQATLLVALAVVLAWLTTKFVEEPIRKSRRLGRNPSKTIWAGIAILVVTVTVVVNITPRPNETANPKPSPSVDSASSSRLLKEKYDKALSAAITLQQLPENLNPDILLPDEGLTNWGRGCFQSKASKSEPPSENCVFGDQQGSKTYWLIGDSHARSWVLALDAIAKKNNAKLIFHSRNSCPLVFKAFYNSQIRADYTECVKTNKWYIEQLTQNPADAIFVASYFSIIDKHIPEYTAALEKLNGLAKRVFILGDVPRHDFQVPQCLARNFEQIGNCAVSTEDGLFPKTIEAMQGKAKELGFDYVSTHQWVCKNAICPAVITNIMMYRDAHHLTMAASDYLTQQLYMAVRWKLDF